MRICALIRRNFSAPLPTPSIHSFSQKTRDYRLSTAEGFILVERLEVESREQKVISHGRYQKTFRSKTTAEVSRKRCGIEASASKPARTGSGNCVFATFLYRNSAVRLSLSSFITGLR